MPKVKVNKIFVAGGQPTATYVERADLGLEKGLKSYLFSGHKLLSVTGPTKSGKTVLCRNVLKENKVCWINGGDIKSENDLWSFTAHQLKQAASATRTKSTQDQEQTSSKTGAEGGLPLFKAKMEVEATGTETFGETTEIKTHIDLKSACLDNMKENDFVLVIDDFHYIEPEVQTDIIRALKGPIFDGLRSIILAVPHRAYDAQRVENEMTGRVGHLPIPQWTKTDLEEIPSKGFRALNIECKHATLQRFLKECYYSPHLMQDFCLKLCLEHEIYESQDHHLGLSLGNNANEFFSKIGRETSKPAFDRLARGPRQRTDRIARSFQGGGEGDIYLAVLRALIEAGAKQEMTYEEIRSSLRKVLTDDIPQVHEVSRVLVKMTEIAREQIQGEPVVDWDEENKILHIVDPFFAFFLRWGAKASLDSPHH